MGVTVASQERVERARQAGPGAGHQLVAFVEALLLAVWIGSMVFFSFAVAPSAFAVLPTRELAGKLVTSTIGKVEVIGLASGLLLILIQAVAWKARRAGEKERVLRMLALVVMVAMAGLSRFWISPKMVSLRQQMGGLIDEVPASDPLRVEFNAMHGYSVALMGVALIAGLAVLFITVRSLARR